MKLVQALRPSVAQNSSRRASLRAMSVENRISSFSTALFQVVSTSLGAACFCCFPV
jgi:hypothetical protein